MDVKAPASFEEQYRKLLAKGCRIEDEQFCRQVLERVSYYRLSAYFIPFKTKAGYIEGTSFRRVYRIYEFDRKMRNLLFAAIEEIEVYLRVQFAHYFSHTYGALGYMEPANFSARHNHDKFRRLLQDAIDNNATTPSIAHHIDKYDGNFPLWVIIELFTFGMLSKFYSDLKTKDRKALAAKLVNSSSENLKSWLHCLTELRNLCAHYSRLYNYPFKSIPRMPSNATLNPTRTLFYDILVLKWMHFDPNAWRSEFMPQLTALIEEYGEDIDLNEIGFPANWEAILR